MFYDHNRMDGELAKNPVDPERYAAAPFLTAYHTAMPA
jgi:hypothetical protein